MKKPAVILFLAFFIGLLFDCSGCSKTDEKKPDAGSGPQNNGEKSGGAQVPYYYGLIQEYKTILAEDPHNLAAMIALGNAYYDSGHWKQAAALFERALILDPRNADVRTDMGTSFRNMGMPDRALYEYRRALAHEPMHQNARYNMGIVYAYDKKDYATAVRVWEDLLRMFPNNPHADYMRSCIVTFNGTLQKGSQ